jgi:hypothetical protein
MVWVVSEERSSLDLTVPDASFPILALTGGNRGSLEAALGARKPIARLKRARETKSHGLDRCFRSKKVRERES